MKIFLILLLSTLCFSTVAVAEVNINTASQQELADALKNIGMKKAMAIVEYRKAHGDFNTVDDLTNVDGIGEVTVQINRDMLTTGQKPRDVPMKKQTAVDEHERGVASVEP